MYDSKTTSTEELLDTVFTDVAIKAPDGKSIIVPLATLNTEVLSGLVFDSSLLLNDYLMGKLDGITKPDAYIDDETLASEIVDKCGYNLNIAASFVLNSNGDVESHIKLIANGNDAGYIVTNSELASALLSKAGKTLESEYNMPIEDILLSFQADIAEFGYIDTNPDFETYVVDNASYSTKSEDTSPSEEYAEEKNSSEEEEFTEESLTNGLRITMRCDEDFANFIFDFSNSDLDTEMINEQISQNQEDICAFQFVFDIKPDFEYTVRLVSLDSENSSNIDVTPINKEDYNRLREEANKLFYEKTGMNIVDKFIELGIDVDEEKFPRIDKPKNKNKNKDIDYLL